MDKKNILSINRFKKETGEVRAESDIPKEDYLAYAMAHLLNSTIEKLEMSINNDRVFSRTKYEVLSLFHHWYEAIESKKI